MTNKSEQQAVPVAQEVDELVRLSGDDSDFLSFSGDEDHLGLVMTQHRYYRWGEDCVVAIGEMNRRNTWDDESFDAKCAALETVLTSPALPCKSGEGVDHGLGPHATVVDDCEDGFMSVAIVVGQNVYLAQGGEQITMSREQFARIAKSTPDATQTREAEGVSVDDALAFADKIAERHRQRANDAEARIKAATDCMIQPGEGWQEYSLRLRAALNARGGA